MGRLIVVLFIAAVALGAAPAAGATAPSLEELVAEAVSRSAELAALEARMKAARAMVGPAGALPDPTASVGLSNIPVGSGVALDEDMMSSAALMLSQRVPRSARRRLWGEIQQGEAGVLRARRASVSNGIERAVKQAYYDLQYLDEALTISEENKRVAEDIVATAESLYATGKVGQQDVFQSQVQLSGMVDALVGLRRQRAAAAARLNGLLYRPAGEPVPTMPRLSRGRPPEGSASAEVLMESNSLVRELMSRRRQAEDREELAGRWRQPDYVLMFEYMMRQRLAGNEMSGTDMWSASVGINLPWVNRRAHEAEEEAARQELRAAQEDLEAELNGILARVEELRIEVARAEEQISLVETGLLPQAEGALAAARAAYATGRTDSINVLTNHLSLYRLQLERLQLLREHAQNLAELEHELRGALAPMAAVRAMRAPSGPAMGGASGSAPSGMGGAAKH